MSDTVWILSPLREESGPFSAELGFPQTLAQVLLNRGIQDLESAHSFLFGSLEDLYDPYLMAGMRQAVERIRLAISRNEKILVFGDYDVDGILSVVMMVRALESLGARVDFYIPERLKEGYGLKEKHLDLVRERQANLVISVDCGIKAIGFVDAARSQDVDVIITDHHHSEDRLPDAAAILNPVLKDSGYPDKNLAGVGVVFKMVQALFDGERVSSLPPYLKLVSIGTIADIAALRDENRIFVRFGLKGLEKVSNLGLKRLMEVCGLAGRSISVGDVGYRIGPRINAAGRMGRTDLAVRLFFSDEDEECCHLAQALDNLNSRRQKVEGRIYQQAVMSVKSRSLDKRYKLLLLGCEEWHSGVIGIVATKLKDQFNRPFILFSYEDGKARGSGRSIREFSLINCLDAHKNFFTSYGGHTLAVGCELPYGQMASFKTALNAYACSQISDEQLKKRISIDARLNFSEINGSLLEGLALLSPFGVGNPRPLFLTEDVEVFAQPKVLQDKHSKFLVHQDGRVFEALAWDRTDWAKTIQKGERLALVYSLQSSEYWGEEKWSLQIEDLRKG